jgi:hypothetical protein
VGRHGEPVRAEVTHENGLMDRRTMNVVVNRNAICCVAGMFSEGVISSDFE